MNINMKLLKPEALVVYSEKYNVHRYNAQTFHFTTKVDDENWYTYYCQYNDTCNNPHPLFALLRLSVFCCFCAV